MDEKLTSTQRVKAWIAKNPEKRREIWKRWNLKNREKKKKQAMDWYWRQKEERGVDFSRRIAGNAMKSYYKDHQKSLEQQRKRVEKYKLDEGFKKRMTRYNRENLLKKRGLNQETYNGLLSLQEGKCTICKLNFGKKGAFIDHCHEEGKTRGLICQSCNFILGYVEKQLKGNKNILAEFEKYLKTNNCWNEH